MSPWTRLAAMMALLPLAGCAELQSGPSVAPSTTIRIANRTPRAYLMSVVGDVTSRPLGVVPALEMREFTLPRAMRTRGEVYLVATARNDDDERESIRFHPWSGAVAEWTLDATRLRAIVVRR